MEPRKNEGGSLTPEEIQQAKDKAKLIDSANKDPAYYHPAVLFRSRSLPGASMSKVKPANEPENTRELRRSMRRGMK